MLQGGDVSDVETTDTFQMGLMPQEPSADLLDRAMVGWERFLDSWQGAPHG
ncbi:hypothetical protein [Streptomyces sp. NPDC090021]|uniref:hypothetical protein n=1 Tax=Streptomyces sp. NPDC090021 TaxID=3365919 RepID=UPI00381A870D